MRIVLGERATSTAFLLAAVLIAAPVASQEATPEPAPSPAPASNAVQDTPPEAVPPPAPASNAERDVTPEAATSPTPAPSAVQDTPPEAVPPSALGPAMTDPRTTSFDVDWNAARAALAGLDQSDAPEETAGAPPLDAFARLNAATEKIFPKASASSVPVLLPFDTAALLRDQAQDATGGDDNKT